MPGSISSLSTQASPPLCLVEPGLLGTGSGCLWDSTAGVSGGMITVEHSGAWRQVPPEWPLPCTPHSSVRGNVSRRCGPWDRLQCFIQEGMLSSLHPGQPPATCLAANRLVP